MNRDDAEEYTQSLGQIVAGSWRQIALAKRIGVPKALGLSTESWVNERLGGYVRLSISERREAVKELAAEGNSNRAIADILGVDEGTIRGDAENSALLDKNFNTNNSGDGDSAENSAPLDAFAVLAADEKIRASIKKKQAIEEGREGYVKNIVDGCTVDDLGVLIESGKKFSVIYADPPWSFKVYSGKGKQRSADRHYDTMSLDDIAAIPIGKLAADDCALFLWAVWPEIPGALEIIKAWGFEYKTAGFVFVKETKSANGLHWGMGYWTRANTEPCLLATRGSPKRKAMDVHQVLMSPVGEHSRKPEETSVRIERLLDGPYLELFGRRPMAGWTVWGNQINRGLFHSEIPEMTAATISELNGL